MRAAPDGLYDMIVGFGTPGAQTHDAKIGGVWKKPHYRLSYLLAARMTLEVAAEQGRTDEVALPVAYLQRHAFELAIKDVTGLAYSVAADKQRIQRLQRGLPDECPPERFAEEIHHIGNLLDELKKILAKIGAEDLFPSDLDRVHEHLRSVEEGIPERLRYDRIRPFPPPPEPGSKSLKRKDMPLEGSLPEARVFKLGETQELLENTFARHFIYRHDAVMDLDPDQWTLLESLAVQSMGNSEQLLRMGAEF